MDTAGRYLRLWVRNAWRSRWLRERWPTYRSDCGDSANNQPDPTPSSSATPARHSHTNVINMSTSEEISLYWQTRQIIDYRDGVWF